MSEQSSNTAASPQVNGTSPRGGGLPLMSDLCGPWVRVKFLPAIHIGRCDGHDEVRRGWAGAGELHPR